VNEVDAEGRACAEAGDVGVGAYGADMSRFRLLPTPDQEEALLAHGRDARYVWNLAVEQQQHWQPGRAAPGYLEQAAQLTEARAEYAWLRAGSQTVQQQALRDFARSANREPQLSTPAA
jgi:hypothetical protein